MPAHLIFSSDNGNSIVECISRARDNAHTMRHQMATEMWEALNRFHLDIQRPGRRRSAAANAERTSRFCRSIADFSHLLQGITDSTMPREEGWYFLQAGKFLERAEWTARTVDVNYRLLVGGDGEGGDRLALVAAAPDPAAVGHAPALAVGVRVVPPHREQRHPAERSDRAADSLGGPAALRPVLHREGGRGARAHHARRLPGTTAPSRSRGRRASSEARREAGRLHAEFTYQRLDDLLERGLHVSLLDIQRRCYRIGDRVEDEFFTHRTLRAQDALT